MPLSGIAFDAITEADLKAAIADGLRPGRTIAFAPAAFVHPFVKEVSSLANTRGGDFVIGIEDKEGCATGLAPLQGAPGHELRRLEALLHGITPPIAGLQCRAIALANGGFAVIVRVPASKQVPHKVIDPRDGSPSLVYIRNGQGVVKLHPRAVDEMFG